MRRDIGPGDDTSYSRTLSGVVNADDPAEETAPSPAPPRSVRVQRWVQDRRARLDAAKDTSPTVGFAFDALSYDTDTGAPVLAAALGFRVFLLQVPYALVFVLLAAYLSDWTGREATSFFHGRGIARLTATSVSTAAQLSGWGRFSALLLGLYALVLSARSFVKVVNIVHALVWNVPRTRVTRSTRAAAVLIALITVLIASSLAINALRQRSLLGGTIALALFTLGPFAVWWYASSRLPHQPCPLIALAPGAALFAIGTEVLHIFTVTWFPHYMQSKSEVYGTIGTAIVLLIWAYALGRIITLAAVLNATLWARFSATSKHPLRVTRPSWHLPLFDRTLTRAWTALFGGDEPPDPTSENTPTG